MDFLVSAVSDKGKCGISSSTVPSPEMCRDLADSFLSFPGRNDSAFHPSSCASCSWADS